MPDTPRVAVAQLGARMHYAVPRILHAHGMLSSFHTDLCATRGLPRVLGLCPTKLLPSSLRKLKGRVPTGVPPRTIRTYPLLGVSFYRAQRVSRTSAQSRIAELRYGQLLCESIVRRGLEDSSCVYAFNTAALEIFRHAKQRGVKTVLEQTIAPAAVESRLLADEHNRHKAWPRPDDAQAYATKSAREAEEWSLADKVICASPFVREGLISSGCDPNKIDIVPYGVAPERFQNRRCESQGGPLRVLSVGTVGLRKGTPYIIESARALDGDVEFRVVGPHSIPGSVRTHLPSNLRFTGPIPRAEVARYFEWADVFLLPSICEGSALTTYEALLSGIPVICTPNTGSIIRDGIDGFVVEAGCVKPIIDRLNAIHCDRNLLSELKNATSEAANECSLSAYEARLIASMLQVLDCGSSSKGQPV